jgi:hypothetical protein
MSKAQRRIQVYLSAKHREQLAQHCARSRTSETAVVREALQQYLDGTGDSAVFFRRFDRLTRAADRAERELAILSLAFGVFVRLWLAHTPRIPKEQRADARAGGEGRYREFLDAIALRFTAGKRFLDDLPQDKLADPTELEAHAKAADGPPAASNQTPLGGR